MSLLKHRLQRINLLLKSPATRDSQEADEPLKFMLSNAYYTAPYCAAYNPAAEAKAKELGIDLTT